MQSRYLAKGILPDEGGSTVVAVLGFIVATSLVFATVLHRSMDRYRQVSQTASWQEALLAAEAGADTAVRELRMTLVDPQVAFAGWSTAAEDGTTLPHAGKRYVCPQLDHGGEFNTQMNAVASIDAPPELLDSSDRQWYRIRSTGTTFLPGPARMTLGKLDRQLRQFSFLRDGKTGQAVARPQTTRSVELLLKPTSFESAIVSDLAMSLNNQKIVINSYDSRYPETSTGGLYPKDEPSKQRKNGDIATNSKLINAGDATIHGDAFTNDGVIQNGANISGEQRDDFYQDLVGVKVPNWTGKTVQVTPTQVNGTATLTGGSKDNPTRYKLTAMSVTGTSVLTFAPSSTSPGAESYIEIWLTGDLKTAGSGTMVVQPKTNVTIYLEGEIDIKGNGTLNANSQPGRLQILGVQPPPGQTRNMNFGGNGIMVAAIYAPHHSIIFGATGQTGTMWGSLTGKSVTMGGTTYIHYDEALADSGYITDYKIRGWFEDNR